LTSSSSRAGAQVHLDDAWWGPIPGMERQPFLKCQLPI
jgi:hypothetical protein